MRAFLAVLIVASAPAALAQPRFSAAPDSGRHSSAAAPSTSGSARFSPGPQADTQAERCTNLRRELRSARRQERAAGTTGSSDQASAGHQDLLAQIQRAGC